MENIYNAYTYNFTIYFSAEKRKKFSRRFF